TTPTPTPFETPNIIPAAAAGAPSGAIGLAVSGVYALPGFVASFPSAFPTPTGGIAATSPVSAPITMPTHSLSPGRATPAPSPAGFIAAYAALGSWTESTPGVALIAIAGGVTGGIIATPDVVNSCAAVPSGTFVARGTNPEAVCVANGADIYLIDGTTLVKTLTSGGSGVVFFSGGSCTTCGVVIDRVSGNALISVATADGFGGYQLFNLSTQTLSSVISLGPDEALAEHFAVLPLSSGSFLALSPTENTVPLDGADYAILAIAPPSAAGAGGDDIFTFAGRSILTGTLEDTAALDSTGIIYALDEFRGRLFLADLTQASVNTSAASFTWNAPSQIQSLSELSKVDVDAMAVAYGAHKALVEQESGGSFFGAIKLPATSGSGTPAALDWVGATMPNDPSGASWNNPADPHALTAADLAFAVTSGGVVGGTPHGLGLLINDARTYLAIIDLDGLLAAPRTAATGTGAHTLDPSFDLVANNVVAFAPFP
ncbi:MAG: hypothetical protein ACREQD_09845, partial [Candidatus Binataceae bacterium]